MLYEFWKQKNYMAPKLDFIAVEELLEVEP